MDSRDAVSKVIKQRPNDIEGALVELVHSYDRVDLSKHQTPEFYDKYAAVAPYGPVDKAVRDIVERSDRSEDCVLPVALLIEHRIFNKKMDAYQQYLDPHTE